MKKLFIVLFVVLSAMALLVSACAQTEKSQDQVDTSKDQTETSPDPVDIARGGRLYDNWMIVADLVVPSGDNPVWSRQSTNTRSGADTWRCKECHGWDYNGVQGAYAIGSHKTGFPGILLADRKTREQLTERLNGEIDSAHDFSAMTDVNIEYMVDFMKLGMISTQWRIDLGTKTVIANQALGIDLEKGKQLYDATCASCHGSDGKTIDFGDGVGVGALADDNPWETLHKIRFGSPGSAMPSAIVNGWSDDDSFYVLAYSQSLPE